MEFQRAVPPGPGGAPGPRRTLAWRSAIAPWPSGPNVAANFVSTADGKATAQGRMAQLGGEGDRAVFRLLRTQVDAVLAGTGTLRDRALRGTRPGSPA